MPETLLVLGGILGLTLSGLLASTIAFDKFKFWPTPGHRTWQSFLFWGLFRSLNVTTLALALHAPGCTNVYRGRNGLVTGGVYAWTRNPQSAMAVPA
jgi:hypothetical protein